MEEILKSKGVEIDFADARELDLRPFYKGWTEDIKELETRIKDADNLVIGYGIHNYTMPDSLKMILDTCFREATGKFYGQLVAAGGDRSYLSTMHLTQTCINQYRMIQLPRVVYATGADVDENAVKTDEIVERLEQFAADFVEIGGKLIA